MFLSYFSNSYCISEVCRTHWEQAKNAQQGCPIFPVFASPSTTVPPTPPSLPDLSDSCPIDVDMRPESPAYSPSGSEMEVSEEDESESEEDEVKRECQIKETFLKFVKAIGGSRTSPRKSFDKYSPRTISDKVIQKIQVMTHVDAIMAPGHEEELKQKTKERYCENREDGEDRFSHLLREVAHQYNTAVNRLDKTFLLSSIARQVPFGVVSKYIAGLSKRQYDNAKRRALTRRPVHHSPSTRQKYDPEALGAFIDFLTRLKYETG